MYEPTAKGAWFKWEALDRAEKRLVWASFACLFAGFAIAFTLIGLTANAYRAGYRMGSDGIEPSAARIAPLMTMGTPFPDAEPIAAAILIGLGILFWILFSRRQDELFNRVQNRAYGQGSFITFGLMALWLLLERVANAPPMSTLGVIVIWWAASLLVWFREARRLWR